MFLLIDSKNQDEFPQNSSHFQISKGKNYLMVKKNYFSQK